MLIAIEYCIIIKMKEEDEISWIKAWLPFKKDYGFHVLFIIYLIALVADLVSTIRLGELVRHLEANPLFGFMNGGLPLIIILNLVIAGVYYTIYRKGSVNARFYVCFCLIAVITTRLIAISNNMAVAANPPTLEQAMSVTQAMKTETVKKLVLVNVLPFFNGIFAWIFFSKDHKVEKK